MCSQFVVGMAGSRGGGYVRRHRREGRGIWLRRGRGERDEEGEGEKEGGGRGEERKWVRDAMMETETRIVSMCSQFVVGMAGSRGGRIRRHRREGRGIWLRRGRGERDEEGSSSLSLSLSFSLSLLLS